MNSIAATHRPPIDIDALRADLDGAGLIPWPASEPFGAYLWRAYGLTMISVEAIVNNYTVACGSPPLAYQIVNSREIWLGPIAQLEQSYVEQIRALSTSQPESSQDPSPLGVETITGAVRFAAGVLRQTRGDSPDMIGDVDGGWLQDYALECGLLTRVDVTESCGEGCSCDGELDYCYRLSEAGKALWDVPA